MRIPPLNGVSVLTDVTNPLCGPRSAARVFGMQKGFRDAELVEVDEALTAYAQLFSVDSNAPGAGASGGTGFALLACSAQLVSGSGAVAELIGLRPTVARASVVVTGEGSFDGQSSAGKVPSRVAVLAAEVGTPAALVASRTVPDASTSAFAGSRSLSDLVGSPL